MLLGCKLMGSITHTMRRLLDPAKSTRAVPTDPMPIVRYAISVCRNIAVSARATIHYDGPQELSRLKIGFTELAQVLINVLANATQALHERKQPGGEVWLHVTESEGTMRFVVRDNGPGMSPEIVAKVGTPFFSTRPQGTGLGVAQCRRLIEGEQGEFKLESTVGVGTTVTIVLPKA
jgi:signal transduction histidine kinase